MTKISITVHAIVVLGLVIATADLAAAPRRPRAAVMARAMAGPGGAPTATPKTDGMAAPMTAGAPMATDAGAPPESDPPSPGEVLQPEEHVYRPVVLEVRQIVWFDPGQRGLIEAHPLVMGLAAMALATVTLLFFFLRGLRRPKGGDI
jgi:hypothetical protein